MARTGIRTRMGQTGPIQRGRQQHSLPTSRTQSSFTPKGIVRQRQGEYRLRSGHLLIRALFKEFTVHKDLTSRQDRIRRLVPAPTLGILVFSWAM